MEAEAQLPPNTTHKRANIHSHTNPNSLAIWSEWRDSNPRPLVPQTSALTGLRYTPTLALIEKAPLRRNAARKGGRPRIPSTRTIRIGLSSGYEMRLLERLPTRWNPRIDRNRSDSKRWSMSESKKSSNFFGICSSGGAPHQGCFRIPRVRPKPLASVRYPPWLRSKPKRTPP